MIAKLKTLWGKIPHPYQALILGAVTVSLTTAWHAFQEGNCYTTACLKHYAVSGIFAGLAVIKAFYMLPNGTAQIVAQAKVATMQPPQK